MVRKINKLSKALGVEVNFYRSTGFYEAAIKTPYSLIQVFQDEEQDELTASVLGWMQNNADYIRSLVELHTLLLSKGLFFGIFHYRRKKHPFDSTLVYGEIYTDEARTKVLRRVGANMKISKDNEVFLIYEMIKTAETL